VAHFRNGENYSLFSVGRNSIRDKTVLEIKEKLRMCKRGIKTLREAVQEQTIGKVVWISGEGLMYLRMLKSFVAVMGVKVNVSRNITRRKKKRRRRRE